MLEIQAAGEKCLCDFTFDFYWQHKGSRLDPSKTISSVSLRQMVEALRQGETIKICGDVGSRLGSSLGVDLVRFGGKGGPIEETGKIVVDGHVGSRMGISMLRGAIYVSGQVESPLGNILETESDLTGFRKFVSITDALEKDIIPLEPNTLNRNELIICDGTLRETLGARNTTDKTIRLEGDAGMSTGILMRSGQIEIVGDADRNTGVLMQGGKVVVRGGTGDFTGVEMRGGLIYIEGNCGSFACAKMRGGAIYAKEGKPLPPAQSRPLSPSEQIILAKTFGLNQLYTMIYRKFSL
jgi:formylmethanofuran dehydrogenase subunit C